MQPAAPTERFCLYVGNRHGPYTRHGIATSTTIAVFVVSECNPEGSVISVFPLNVRRANPPLSVGESSVVVIVVLGSGDHEYPVAHFGDAWVH